MGFGIKNTFENDNHSAIESYVVNFRMSFPVHHMNHQSVHLHFSASTTKHKHSTYINFTILNVS